jgi:hypothetical protein
MLRIGGTSGLVVVAGVVTYVLVLMAQTNAAENLCEKYPAGSEVAEIEKLDGTFFLTRMGPLQLPDAPGTQRVIFCAGMTMCDTSCSLEIKDRVVTDARYSNH